nr:universal stress protein [Haloparvum sedimenti]
MDCDRSNRMDVLVALDGSDRSEAALEHALATFPGATITGVFVIDPFGSYADDAPYPDRLDDWIRTVESRAADVFERAQATAAERETTVETVTRRGKPAREIAALAEEGGFDHVVVGDHGSHGIADALLGNVAAAVVERSPVTVTVVKGPAEE